MLGHEASVSEEEYKKNPEAFLYLKVDKHMQKVFVNDILYVESWKDYIKIYFTTGKNIMVKQSISSIQNLLSEHNFLIVHSSYIVSLNKISGYNSLAIQLNENDIPIGRLYKQHVMEVINNTR
jgi:DNA-binding LytR/AlgR family response regulator